MTIDYVAKRIGFFLVVVFLASTINFFLPRISSVNPVRERLYEIAQRGGYQQAGLDQLVAEYEAKFGLDKPLLVQYRNYLADMARFDFGVSFTNYPRTVMGLIRETLPWSIALAAIATFFGFSVGTFLGALLGWQRSPAFLKYLFMPLLTLSAVPYYLLGLLLIYVFAFQIPWFPLFGGYSIATFPDWSDLGFLLDVARHAVRPAMSAALVTMGFWALGMRGMMVTNQGEDYMTLADAKGLHGSRIFLRYAVRNALLPQTTGLALYLGTFVSNLILVEIVFSYPGIGGLLVGAIFSNDFLVIQGVVFTVIIAIALATLALDLIYPLLDPRIKYGRA